jgi:hypothetical protein
LQLSRYEGVANVWVATKLHPLPHTLLGWNDTKAWDSRSAEITFVWKGHRKRHWRRGSLPQQSCPPQVLHPQVAVKRIKCWLFYYQWEPNTFSSLEWTPNFLPTIYILLQYVVIIKPTLMHFSCSSID